MKVFHKECRKCKQTLEISMFKDVRKKNGSGEYKSYKHSYCNACESQRQAEYNKTRARPKNVLSWDEHLNKKAESKKARLESLSIEKEQRKLERKLERERVKQEKLKLNAEIGKAKWDAWKESGAIERMQQEYRNKAAQERENMVAKGSKVCSACKEERPLSHYHIRTRKRKDGFSCYKIPYSSCKTCRNVDKRYYEKTPNGRDCKRKRSALHRKQHKKATPKWLTQEHKKQIIDTYELMRDCRTVTGEDYHVDHIVPLNGENICGLHVPWNLQVLPAYINIAKSNK